MHSARYFSLLVFLLLAGCSNGAATHTAPPSSPLPIQPTNTSSPAAPTPLPATPQARTAAQDAATPVPPMPTDAPAPTLAPTATVAPALPAAPQPFKPTLTKLTDGGCCRNPVWHPDGTRVLYTDAAPNQPLAATYAVPADASGPPTVFFPSAATVSPDGSRIAFPDFANNVTRIQEFGKRSTATVANNAAYVWFSRDGRQIAWLERAPGPQPSSNVDRLVRIWVANADGSNARMRGNTMRAAELTWFPDGQRLLFIGRDTDGGNPGIYILDLGSGALTRVVDAFSPRGVRLSPDGGQIVYLATLEEKPEDNGLFVVNADGGAKRILPLGGVRWSPDSKALVILPFQTDNGADQLVRIDAATLGATPLTDRATLPFRIAQDEWQVAPDGTRIVFNALTDSNIYVLRIAP